jgi:hypothetical protein
MATQSNVRVAKGRRSSGLIGLVAIVLGWFLGVYGLIVLLAIALPYIIGAVVAKRYTRRPVQSQRLVSFLCWANLVAWILPPLGAFTSGYASAYGRLGRPTNTNYRTLSIIGLILSLLNSIVGIYLKTHFQGIGL